MTKAMRIVFITAGAGESFYCENCLRDIDLVRALRVFGQDVIVVPMYLPFGLAELDLVQAPIFFGGINVFLQQKFRFFRHSPRWIDRLFDNQRLLRWLSKRAGMTNARALGQTTVSMLQGSSGRQVKELGRLLDWLSDSKDRPEIICLSNALLLGLAGPIRKRLGSPLICLLQDEDGFIDALPMPYRDQAWALMRSQVGSVDCFMAVSRYYADLMQQRLAIPQDRLTVVPMGVATSNYKPAAAPSQTPIIGYLSRLCRFHGLDILFDAFIRLRHAPGLGQLQMRLCGGQERGDRPFVQGLMDRVRAMGLDHDVIMFEGISPGQRQVFMEGLTVLTVPETRPVAAARYVLEALACGVPVVGPASGVFPELQRSTGGLVLYEDDAREVFVKALEGPLRDRRKAFELGQKGRKGLLAGYTIELTAKRFLEICSRLVTP